MMKSIGFQCLFVTFVISFVVVDAASHNPVFFLDLIWLWVSLYGLALTVKNAAKPAANPAFTEAIGDDAAYLTDDMSPEEQKAYLSRSIAAPESPPEPFSGSPGSCGGGDGSIVCYVPEPAAPKNDGDAS